MRHRRSEAGQAGVVFGNPLTVDHGGTAESAAQLCGRTGGSQDACHADDKSQPPIVLMHGDKPSAPRTRR